ncbi:hypothetical protein [Fructobacillus tropaeoli]|uniref:hypothetical protein n=1 Tax=Fructobacillus tropaeoli TaxID=709323 RepID=UPI001314784F|nr:hypothetical protein [Fructobacillus tropaeoli]
MVAAELLAAEPELLVAVVELLATEPELLVVAVADALADTLVEALRDVLVDALTDALVEALVDALVEALTDALVEVLVDALVEALVDALTDVLVEVTELPLDELLGVCEVVVAAGCVVVSAETRWTAVTPANKPKLANETTTHWLITFRMIFLSSTFRRVLLLYNINTDLSSYP